jgi:hypothetical protein
MKNIKGNSMTPCPKEIKTPAILSLNDFAIVTANRGPGAITPDNDMKITESKKK